VTRLAIATPVRGHDSFSGSVTVGYSEARMALARRMPVEIISASVTYGCDLVRARNRIVAQVLRSMPEITHVLWWDDDEWPEDVGISVRSKTELGSSSRSVRDRARSWARRSALTWHAR